MKKSSINHRVPGLIAVGSIGYDTIETPAAMRKDLLGGSVCYACLAARLYTRPGMVGVVGEDFGDEHLRLLEVSGVDVSGLERRSGRTFRWSGVYGEDLNQRRTRSTELNVFAEFEPVLPKHYRRTAFVFLANIAPKLQLRVLEQVHRSRLVLVDTMDLWIEQARDELRKVISKSDVLTLNEWEARRLTGCRTLPAAARELRRWGPRWVIVKKGEHGGLMYGPRGFFAVPAYPLEEVADPTGAGDAFAGGFMGYLAAAGKVGERAVREAMLHGAAVASFAVERFGLERLYSVSRGEVRRRVDLLRRMMSVV